MKTKKVIQIVAGTAVTAAGVYIFLKGADIKELASEIAASDPIIILLCCIGVVFSLVLRAWRWKLILPASCNAGTGELFSHTIIGFMLNNILPARIGEAARAFLLWKKNRVSATVSVGSLILERIIDVLVFMLFFAIPALILPELKHLRNTGWLAVVIFIVAAAGIALFARFPRFITGIILKLKHVMPGRFHSRMAIIAKELASSLNWMKSPGRLAWVAVLSIVTPFCYALALTLMAGRLQNFGLLHGSFVLSFAVIGAAIPLAPGYVGTLHATMLQGFVLLNIDANHGRALAVLYHAVGYIPVTAVGLVYFFRADVSFSDLSHANKIPKG